MDTQKQPVTSNITETEEQPNIFFRTLNRMQYISQKHLPTQEPPQNKPGSATESVCEE